MFHFEMEESARKIKPLFAMCNIFTFHTGEDIVSSHFLSALLPSSSLVLISGLPSFNIVFDTDAFHGPCVFINRVSFLYWI